MLPDEILLAIFDFYVGEEIYCKLPRKEKVESWQTLVHVCQRWRSVVFGSPRRLNLQLVYTPRIPVLETLDVWPVLPLTIRCEGWYPMSSIGNILAALKCSDRICGFHIIQPNEWLPMEKVFGLMQVPFPELTDLTLYLHFEAKAVLPDSFLNGSAPRLRSLGLVFAPFPGLPKLLLSTTHLVRLSLLRTPRAGYISPEMMVTCLSTLTNLESLILEFNHSPLPPAQESQPRHLSTRSVLPALREFTFYGSNRYLEVFVARIDVPKLNKFWFDPSIQFNYDRPQLDDFFSRTPSLQAPENAPRVTYP
jgi:hypothetical protein